MNKTYDAIVVGAGSVGMPTAMALGAQGVRTLVIDMHPSPGQGENKHAIGGVRATHSAPGKILACLRSIEILSTWQKHPRRRYRVAARGLSLPGVPGERRRTAEKPAAAPEVLRAQDRFRGPRSPTIVPGINIDGLGRHLLPGRRFHPPLLVANALLRQFSRMALTTILAKPLPPSTHATAGVSRSQPAIRPTIPAASSTPPGTRGLISPPWAG